MFKHWKQGLVVAVAAASLTLPLTAAGALSDDKVKIGVLSDMSGVYKSLEGPGTGYWRQHRTGMDRCQRGRHDHGTG